MCRLPTTRGAAISGTGDGASDFRSTANGVDDEVFSRLHSMDPGGVQMVVEEFHLHTGTSICCGDLLKPLRSTLPGYAFRNRKNPFARQSHLQ